MGNSARSPVRRGARRLLFVLLPVTVVALSAAGVSTAAPRPQAGAHARPAHRSSHPSARRRTTASSRSPDSGPTASTTKAPPRAAARHRAQRKGRGAQGKEKAAQGKEKAAQGKEKAAQRKEKAAQRTAVSKYECYLKLDRISTYGVERHQETALTLWVYTGTLAHDAVVVAGLEGSRHRAYHVRRWTGRLRRNIRRFRRDVASRTRMMDSMKETVCSMTPAARAAAWQQLRRKSAKIHALHQRLRHLARRDDGAIRKAEHRR